MRLLGLSAVILITGCSLAGDLTPPPQSLAPQPEAISNSAPEQAHGDLLSSPPDAQPDLTQGAEIFSEKCAPCHGDLGLGGGSLASNLPPEFPPAPIGDLAFARTALPEDWFHIVSLGLPDRFMPGFASLSAKERWDVVGYSFWLALANGNLQTVEELFDSQCSDCHTDDSSTTPSFTSIATSNVDDLYQSINNGIEPGMPAFGELLAEEQRLALANFFMLRSLEGSETLAAADVPVIEQTQARIRGQIVNGSAGGVIPHGLQAILHAFEDATEIVTKETAVDVNGEFVFADIEVTAEQVLVVTAEYQGVLYGTEILQGAPEDNQVLTLNIFQSTTDYANVVVDRLHAIFSNPAAGILEVTEYWIISNYGDETVADADGEGILEIYLPENVSNLIFEDGSIGNRFQISDSGFIDRTPIRPGEQNHEIIFSFEIAYDKELDFSQLMQFPVQAIVMLSPEPGPLLSGISLQDMGIQELNGIAFNSYNTSPLNPGDRLEATVKSSSTSSALPSSSTDILLGGFALAAALFAARFWWTRLDRNTGGEKPRPSQPVLKSQDDLVQRIADLDDAFADSEIEEDDYLEQRKTLKWDLLRKLKDNADD